MKSANSPRPHFMSVASGLGPLSPSQERSSRRLFEQWVAWGTAGFEWAVKPAARESGTDPVESFLRSGSELWAEVHRHALALGLVSEGAWALDFGCGPGRITQALANSFGHVEGYDVAPGMIELAAKLNRMGDRCQFHVWQRPDLGGLPTAKFDLVFCAYLFQHLPRWLAWRYVRELVRVTAPGGTVVIQMHGDLTVPLIGLLPSELMSRAYDWSRRSGLLGSARRGPWQVHWARPSAVRGVIERAGADLVDVERASKPDGRMVSFWFYARRRSTA